MNNSGDLNLNPKDVTANMVRILAKQKRGVSICHINAQSLNNKIDEFRVIFENSKMDLICVSETWFEVSMPDSLVRLDGYNIFRSDRARHGGGVAIYARKSLNCRTICKSDAGDPIEHILVELLSSGSKMMIGCVYRPNRNIRFSSLMAKLESITVAYHDVIIAGDFNSNILLESNLTDEMAAIGLLPTNLYTPTHYTTTASTLLDIFFVGDQSNVLLYDQISASCFSKHDLIFISYDFCCQRGDEHYLYRDFKNINYNQLYDHLSLVDWDSIYRMPSIDDKLYFVESTVQQLFETSVPLRTKRITAGNKPWFSAAIKQAINHRDMAYTRWKRYKTSELKELHRLARNHVNLLIKSAKSIYYSNRFNSALNSGRTWKIIKEIGLGRDEGTGNCSVDADELNQTFTNIPLIQADANFYGLNNPQLDSSSGNVNTYPLEEIFEFSCVMQSDVLTAFGLVKSNAVGCDNLHPKFIKILIPIMLPYITHIFNSIIMSSYFPMRWKHAKIRPIPKSNTEYRPIALLCYLSKVLEKLIQTQICSYINEKHLLSDVQSGFRSDHSCTTALVEVSENIRRELDDGKLNFLVLLDHSKAFDTVDHSILCMKLRRFYNFSPTSVKLISSYLTGRTQSVHVKDSISRPLALGRGVPQGSILGPILFSLYANDLPAQLSHCKMHMYADDVQLYLSCPTTSIPENLVKLNYDLQNIHQWAIANGLCLNPGKSKCLVIRKRTTCPTLEFDISIDNRKIEIVSTAKNLGIVFNSYLTWSNHISTLVGQSYVKLRTLWSTQSFVPQRVRMLLAKAYLIPKLLYGCELFSSCDSESTRKLNVLYNNIIRYVFGLRKYDHVSSYARSLYGVSFENLLKIRTLLLLHKIIYTEKPKYLHNQLQFARSNRGKRLILPMHRCLVSEWQFLVTAVRLWNTLPHSQQLLSNATHFRKFLFQHFA